MGLLSLLVVTAIDCIGGDGKAVMVMVLVLMHWQCCIGMFALLQLSVLAGSGCCCIGGGTAFELVGSGRCSGLHCHWVQCGPHHWRKDETDESVDGDSKVTMLSPVQDAANASDKESIVISIQADDGAMMMLSSVHDVASVDDNEMLSPMDAADDRMMMSSSLVQVLADKSDDESVVISAGCS